MAFEQIISPDFPTSQGTSISFPEDFPHFFTPFFWGASIQKADIHHDFVPKFPTVGPREVQ